MNIQGKFLGATPIKEVGEKGYKVRSFYLDITDNPDYPNTPEFGLGGDRVDLVNSCKKGDVITVHFNIRGMKYKNKTTGKDAVFTKIECWKIENVGESFTMPATSPDSFDGDNDDLPF